MSAIVSIDLDDLLAMKAEARGFSFLPKQPVGSLLSGRHASRLRGRGLSFEEMRVYHPGDDIRAIDWRATARLRKPHVRVYAEERERPVLLLVDQRVPMFFGSRRVMKSVVAAELAALAAWRVLDVGDRVGGIVFNEEEQVEIRPKRGATQALRVLHEVARLNQRLSESAVPVGDVSINAVLQSALQQARHDHLVILISDLDGANDETGDLAMKLAAHNDLMIVAVYDPLGIQLIGSDGMRARDRARSWDVPGGQAFTEAFRREFEKVLDHWMSFFGGLRIPVLPITTARPVIGQVHQVIGDRR